MSPANQKETKEQSQKSPPRTIRPTIQIKRETPDRLTQGDFYKDITIIERLYETTKEIELDEITYPLSVLLTQDCDLNSDCRSRQDNKNLTDYSKRKNNGELVWLIFAPVYIFTDFTAGEHLSGLEMKMSPIQGSTLLEKIQQNEIPRYHFLRFADKEKLPEMIIDFKHFFTISNMLFSADRLSKFEYTAQPLFREFLSQRFAYYLSRIGLPD